MLNDERNDYAGRRRLPTGANRNKQPQTSVVLLVFSLRRMICSGRPNENNEQLQWEKDAEKNYRMNSHLLGENESIILSCDTAERGTHSLAHNTVNSAILLAHSANE